MGSGRFACPAARRFPLYEAERREHHAHGKKLLSALICVAVLAAGCGLAALATDGAVSYIDHSWNETTNTLTDVAGSVTSYTVLTGQETSLSEGWYVARGLLTYTNDRLTLNGDVHLILENGCMLTASQGITVPAGGSLTIYAQSKDVKIMGRLEAEAPGDQNYNAAIGGLDQQTGGRVTIHDGSVKATAGKGGSGIGGGWGGNGEVTVYGGAVEAITCDIGAGLGSGTFGVGTVTIHGGSVTASATRNGAAIGGGYVASERQFVCYVTIKGGCVTASATSDGAAIGGGLMDRGTLGCDVSIKGGSVTASASGNGAAIGGGRVNDGSLDCVVSLGLTQDTDYVNAQSYRANNDTLTLTQPMRILGESGRFTGSTGTRTFAGKVVIPASSGDTLFTFPDNADFTLPDDLTEVGAQAFEGTSATTVEAPAGVTEVGANAFSGSGLQKIRFLGEHTIVDAAAFADCESVTAFAIPGTDTWKSLGVIPGIILMPIT